MLARLSAQHVPDSVLGLAELGLDLPFDLFDSAFGPQPIVTDQLSGDLLDRSACFLGCTFDTVLILCLFSLVFSKEESSVFNRSRNNEVGRHGMRLQSRNYYLY